MTFFDKLVQKKTERKSFLNAVPMTDKHIRRTRRNRRAMVSFA